MSKAKVEVNAKLFDVDKPFSIYGLGQAGKKLALNLMKKEFNIQCIIDIKALDNPLFEDILCITPEQCSQHQVKQVILGVFNREVSPKGLQQTLIANGVEVILSFQEINEYIPHSIEPTFWFNAPLDMNRLEKELSDMRSLFNEELSIHTFEQLVKFRKTFRISDHVEGIGLEKQYFDVHIPGWLNLTSITLLDCGAFDGDTLRAAIQYNIPVHNAYCFEPDGKNFTNLVAFCREQNKVRCHAIPCATWSSSTQLSFQSNEGEASHILDDAKSMIQAVAIDDYLINTPFNFIKIDVEGADLDTLKGAIRNIIQFRPYIAVALYHRPNDLWEIPLYLSQKLTDYQYFLRQHGHNGIDTILYAVPCGSIK